MKILGVKFENINALQGEWEIRFDRPPLSDTSLFAIVGPNGSGKSSILDAITLGLYGETARLKNPEQEPLGWKAVDSYSEVTFSVEDELYHSRWSVRKAGDNVEPPQMQLYRLNGGETLLEDRVIRVRSRIGELTGLDFKRFCRTVLLAQGEFTALLNALENERVEILERIMGPEMIRELEDSIRTRAAVESERLLQLKESAASFSLPPKELTRRLRDSHEQTVEEYGETTAALEELRQLEEWIQGVQRLAADREEASLALTEAEARFGKAQDDLQRLERVSAAAPLAEGLRLLDALKTERTSLQERLKAMERAIPSQDARLGEIEERLPQIRTAVAQARGELEIRDGDLTDAFRRDREIELESQRFLEAVSRYENLQQSLKEKVEEQSTVPKGISASESRRGELQHWLADHADESGLEAEIPALEELLQRLSAIRGDISAQEPERDRVLQTERQATKELDRAERAFQKARHKRDRVSERKAERERRLHEILEGDSPESLITSLHDRVKKLTACKALLQVGQEYQPYIAYGDIWSSLAEIEAKRQILAQSIESERGQLDELGEQIRLRDTFQRLGSDRAALATDRPCPLCGSLHHPFVEEGPPDFTELDKAVQGHEQRIDALEEELGELSARAARLQTVAQDMDRLREAWAQACAEVGGEWPITDLNAVLAEITSTQEEIKRTRSRIRSARWRKWMLSWADRGLKGKEEKLARKEAARDSAHSIHESANEARLRLEGEISRLEEEETTLRSRFARGVRKWGGPSPKLHHEIGSLEPVRSRWESYRRRHEEYESLTQSLQELERKQEFLPGIIEELQSQADAIAAETQAVQERLNALKAEREALYGSLDPVRERETLMSAVDRLAGEEAALSGEMENLRRQIGEEKGSLPSLRESAEKAQAAFEVTEKEALQRLTVEGFESLDEVRELLSVTADERSIMDELASAKEALATARSRAQAAQEAEEATRAERKSEETIEMVRWKITEGNKRRDDLQRLIDETERTLAEHREAEREYRELLQAIGVQEKIWDEAMEEQKELESEEEGAPRKKLQRLMLERLVEQTNKHLLDLSGRYALRTGAGDGLGLDIEDSRQGKTHRSVKTLSGGESFLVSLCLALGLAELAGRERTIQSLFIDEGFGVLDDETLYRVMATLKGLRENGKMVGIISHVKRLAEEIPTQIRVEKEPGGTGRIAIVA